MTGVGYNESSILPSEQSSSLFTSRITAARGRRMFTARLMNVDRDGESLVVTPQTNVTSLAEDNVRVELDELIARLHGEGVKNVIFDMGHMNYFGSSMLEAMRQVWNVVRDFGGKIVICNLSTVGREILQLSRFDKVWDVAANRQQALALVSEA